MNQHDILTKRGYEARLFELLYQFREKRAPTLAAWLQVEQERRSVGKPRYTSYSSFRSGISRSIAKRKRVSR